MEYLLALGIGLIASVLIYFAVKHPLPPSTKARKKEVLAIAMLAMFFILGVLAK